MPFCCQCGSATTDTDTYCGACGTRQPVTPKRKQAANGLSPRTASILCYIPVVGWIPAIVVLASQRFRNAREVRFHAFQGIYLFVAWLLVDWVIAPLYHLPLWHGGHLFPGIFVGGILKTVIFFGWIFMLIKTSQEETFKLPLLGELAERSVAEQR
ncbi:MAG TPA: hypothetical protein VLE22_07285 [Bryobacteraceae bacterium]|nr:hypothetical protein [Bryobacteraceae bacterium]